jgi:hypothetical protein
MVGSINLKSGALTDQIKTGKMIIELIRTVGDESPGSEWKAFKADPKGWLHKAGYRYAGPGTGPDQEIPASVTLIPVYDTENTMYVRVPWKGVLVGPIEIRDEPAYPTVAANRFPVLLARYFMRKCR